MLVDFLLRWMTRAIVVPDTLSHLVRFLPANLSCIRGLKLTVVGFDHLAVRAALPLRPARVADFCQSLPRRKLRVFWLEALLKVRQCFSHLHPGAKGFVVLTFPVLLAFSVV